MKLATALKAAALVLWIAFGMPGLTAQPGSYCLNLEQRNSVLAQLLELDSLKIAVLPRVDSAITYYQVAYQTCTEATTASQAALRASQQQVAGLGLALRLTQERIQALEAEAKRKRWRNIKTVLTTALASFALGLGIGIFAP